MKDFLCQQRYTCATIFIDHFSDITYTHLQRSTSLQDTIAAISAFDFVCDRCSIKVCNYHTHNGPFADQGFVGALGQNHIISFCGAYTHWQNGKAENFIKDLQD